MNAVRTFEQVLFASSEQPNRQQHAASCHGGPPWHFERVLGNQVGRGRVPVRGVGKFDFTGNWYIGPEFVFQELLALCVIRTVLVDTSPKGGEALERDRDLTLEIA